MKKSNLSRGFTFVGVVIATVILGVGVSTVVQVRNVQRVQEQYLAAGAQRASYATFQQGITAQGIDPTRILNPLASLAPTVISSGSNATSAGAISVVGGTVSTRNGGAVINSVQTQSSEGSGDRAGGLGLVSTNSGSTSIAASVALLPPVLAVTFPLATSNFPATSWFILPSNPAGTVYRYTTDGSAPTSTSPAWNFTAASAIGTANFPVRISMASFNPDARYIASSVMATGSITMALPILTFARSGGGASQSFVYADQIGANGILLSPSASLAGITHSIRYTVDATNPATSGTASNYAGNFVVPFTNWSGASPVATLMAVATSTDPRYVSQTPSSFALTSSLTQLPAPAFSMGNGAVAARGSVMPITHVYSGNGVLSVFSDKWQAPSVVTSPAGYSVVIQ